MTADAPAPVPETAATAAPPGDGAPPAAPTAPEPAPVPPKKVKYVRWWGIILLLVTALLLFVALPFLVNPWVEGKIRNQLAANGWELTPESQLSFSIYGATLHGEKLVLRMIEKSADGSQEQVATADRLHAEVGVLASLTTSDVVINELAIEGMTGNLRRGPDGRIKSLPPPTPEEKSKGIEWGKIDWVGWYQKGMEQLKKRQEEQKQAEQQPKPDEPVKPVPPPEPLPPEPDIEWPKAVKYQPTPKADRHIPRVVIRKLAVSGKAVKLPDESPFEVASFALKGSDIALRQDLGETMLLTGTVTTKAAGDLNIDLERKAEGTGRLKIAAPAVPVEAIASPAVSGDRLVKYGAKGLANLTIDNTWNGWDLVGNVTSTVSGLSLSPTATDSQTQRVAQVVNALKGKPIAWPVKLGGTLYAPTVTDSGVDEVLKGGVLGAATDLAKEKAGAEAQKQIDKQLEKHPEAKEATDKAKDALKGLFNK